MARELPGKEITKLWSKTDLIFSYSELEVRLLSFRTEHDVPPNTRASLWHTSFPLYALEYHQPFQSQTDYELPSRLLTLNNSLCSNLDRRLSEPRVSPSSSFASRASLPCPQRRPTLSPGFHEMMRRELLSVQLL